MTDDHHLPAPRDLPERAGQTTAECPWPVRLLSSKMSEYIARMSPVWIEGQVVELNRRTGSGMAFLTLRDIDAEISLPVHIYARDLPDPEVLREGAHVVVHTKANFWEKSGRLSMHVREVRAIGVGELLARIEHLKRVLAAEGLFAADRKRALPFLPARIGLICGRDSKAEHDVVVNARDRWPQVQFEIREVAVQGARCVPEVVAALQDLDSDPRVDVIVVTRGGGSVEDLLPFSNETMVRAVAACATPVVSAVGHETDSPLLDLVADLRASTPTDAAKRIVPDVAAERHGIAQARDRIRRALELRLRREEEFLAGARARPVLADPGVLVTAREQELERLRHQAWRAADREVERAGAVLDGLRGKLHALSPAATLDRGYAVLRRRDGSVVRSAAEVEMGERLEARVATGRLGLEVMARADESGHPLP